MKCGTYMFLIASGSKMCAQIIVPTLAPSLLQRSQWYFADTYLGWSWSAVQYSNLNAQDPAKCHSSQKPLRMDEFCDLQSNGFAV